MKFAALHHAEKPSRHKLVFDIPMQILILWLIAFHGTLRRVHLLPLADAVCAESCLASRALLWIEKNFETD